jgi:20S proteasome subunit beta 6
MIPKHKMKLVRTYPHLLLACLFHDALEVAAAGRFNPYQDNGGLVSAVAGKDYVVIATDTRMFNEYHLHERNHIRSRLWSAAASSTKLEQNKDDGTFELINNNQNQVWIASSGCNADCDALRRMLRSELHRAHVANECDRRNPDNVAAALAHALYTRRTYPFMSYCVVAGLCDGHGQVYVFDAIGSHEQVAVATAGTGRELLQPILDGKFQSILSRHQEVVVSGEAVEVLKTQQYQPLVTQVSCTSDEAVAILVDAYRSVSEREIGVGDQVVICIVRRNNDEDHSEIVQYPLKKH